MAAAVQVVKRAEDEDLNKDVRYRVSFIRNAQGRVITDVSLLNLLSRDHDPKDSPFPAAYTGGILRLCIAISQFCAVFSALMVHCPALPCRLGAMQI